MKNKKLASFSTALALGFSILLPMHPAMAATTNSHAASLGSFSVVEGEAEQKAINELRQTIDGKSISVNTDMKNLDWDNAYVGELDGKKIVTVPITGVGDSWSNFTAYYSEDGTIEDYTEGHFKQLTETSGHVTVYLNGKLSVDDTFQDSDNKTAHSKPGASVAGIGDAIAELNDCLSAAGIPAWVVAGATALCSSTGWAGILACYTAAGVAGGTVGFCMGKASKKL